MPTGARRIRLAVHVDVSLDSLRSLFSVICFSFLFVIDESNKVIGVVRDVDVHRPSLRSLRTNLEAPERCVDQGVTEIMSPTLSVREDAPLRLALVQMASSRARQVPVLTSRGELLASLVDVDGLRWLAHHG
jgi:CBS-domain-containing membrane protein